MLAVGCWERRFTNTWPKNNAKGDPGIIDQDDWKDWYSLRPERDYTRKGPYVSVVGSPCPRPPPLRAG